MNRLRPLTRAAIVAAGLALSACAAMQRSQHASPPANPPESTPVETAPEPQAADSGATAGNPDTRPADMVNAAPPCTCAEAKAKPRPRPKPKPVHKEAPPQLGKLRFKTR